MISYRGVFLFFNSYSQAEEEMLIQLHDFRYQNNWITLCTLTLMGCNFLFHYRQQNLLIFPPSELINWSMMQEITCLAFWLLLESILSHLQHGRIEEMTWPSWTSRDASKDVHYVPAWVAVLDFLLGWVVGRDCKKLLFRWVLAESQKEVKLLTSI